MIDASKDHSNKNSSLRRLVSDCEGPFTKNDIAFELLAAIIPDGAKLFQIISKYDDILVDIVKKPGYNAGDTLKLILPFLKAFGLTDQKTEEFSARNLVLIRSTRETLKYLLNLTDVYIVSTSYEHYLRALCKYVNFPFENTYCTRVSLDRYTLISQERDRLITLAKEISAFPLITIPDDAKSLKDLSDQDQAIVKRLNEIFWKEICAMSIGKIFEVTPIGGEQKAEAIRKIVEKTRISISNIMYVGDSITDVEAFQLVRKNGGLSVSFNGNSYAIKAAEVAVQSESNLVTAALADIFCRHGKQAAIKAVEGWSMQALEEANVDQAILTELTALYPDCLPKVQIVTSKNMESLIKESSEFRKKVRGVNIGRLG
jgi:energy-converting hydrogenase A subunit R